MTDRVIPPAALLAAKRGFINTSAQAYSTSLAGGITLAAATDAFDKASSGDWAPLVLSAVVFLFSPLLAGAASFFRFLARGVPVEYGDAALSERQGE